MSDFITDVERQYEMYCKIAEEHGFIDLNAKKNGFRCTTKSSEFNAGWIAFVGAVAAVRDEQQAIIENLKAQLNNMEACYIEKKKELEELQGQLRTWKGQSLAAMLHGTCKCGEPWQSIVSDKESFNRLHCFNCNNDRYENKEFFGDHEPKSLRGAND